MTLLIVDVQKGITDERLYQFERFIENIKTLIGEARKRNIEVIYVQHDDGPGSGFSVGDEDYEIYLAVAPQKGEKVYRKTVNSCFSNKDLCKYLKQKKEDTVIIAGLMTNYCIDASIKSAFDLGYTVIVPIGCNSTTANPYMDAETTYRYYNEDIWPGCFAQCISREELFE